MSKQDWERHHRRYQLVNEMAARPEMLAEPVAPRVLDEFGGREHALRAIHQRWVTLVNGCLDVEFETGSDDNGAVSLARAARRAAAHSPELVSTLDRLKGDPLIASLNTRFHLRLGESIGVNRPGTTVSDTTRAVRRILAQAAAAEAATPTPRRLWRPRHPFRWGRRPEAVELV